MKRRIREVGRDPASVAVLPGIVFTLGSTEAEARERDAELAALVNPVYGLKQLTQLTGVDFTELDLDEPFPAMPSAQEHQGVRGWVQMVTDMAARDRLTVRQMIARLANGRGHRVFVGTPEQLADDLARWQREGAADGFNLMPSVLPSGLTDFVDHVIPVLQQRGLFRREYTGTTLREHFGLPSPAPDGHVT
jgi:alkanesulfonate monooxygenase SsuD/methylene tetrahydromethanopterin reductase-like flavin-dependent oxidoreductase (luciferase family)